MRAIRILAAGVAIMFAGGVEVQAAVITGFNIPQTDTGYTFITPIGGGAPEVTATPLTRAATLTGSAFGNHFYFSNWGTTVDLTKFYATTLTVVGGSELLLSDVSYSVEDTTHPIGQYSTFHVRTSLDGFSSDIDSFTLNNDAGLVVDRITDLSGLGAITGSIEFRFYATTASTSVTMGFANHLPGGAGGGLPDVGQNIRFNGSVVNVPEPSSMAIFGIGVCIAGAASRRRRIEAVNAV